MAMPQEDAEATKLNMTPMIDVVFQLLIFFLCTMKFKTLDQKIEAFLPKDRGLAATPTKPPDVPKIVAVLKRDVKKGETHARLKVANVTIGDLGDANAATTLAKLTEMARAARTAAGTAADEVKGEVDASSLVYTGDVLKTVDAFIAGGLKDVTFVGTPEPGSVLDKLKDELGIR